MVAHRGKAGGFEYELVYELAGEHGTRLAGLTDIEALRHAYDSARSGSNEPRSALGRGLVGPRSVGGRAGASADKPASMRVVAENADDEAEKHFQPAARSRTPYTNGAEAPSLAAAGS
jgi:hypothetical protein